MENCIFCKIADKQIPGKIIYEDDLCLAFLDLSQVTDGHTLIIPKAHYDSILEADSAVVAHIYQVAQKLANKLVDTFNANGCNILTNAKEAAGQTVHHFHVHIIPRYDETDGLTLRFKDRSQEVDLDAIYHRIVD